MNTAHIQCALPLSTRAALTGSSDSEWFRLKCVQTPVLQNKLCLLFVYAFLCLCVLVFCQDTTLLHFFSFAWCGAIGKVVQELKYTYVIGQSMSLLLFIVIQCKWCYANWAVPTTKILLGAFVVFTTKAPTLRGKGIKWHRRYTWSFLLWPSLPKRQKSGCPTCRLLHSKLWEVLPLVFNSLNDHTYKFIESTLLCCFVIAV